MIPTARPISDWDAAYANRDSVLNADAFVDPWPVDAERFRSDATCRLDIAYGGGEREKLDLFLPGEEAPKGLFVFVHGGYWLRFSRKEFSHFAEGAVARGWAVALPSYDLCPSVGIGKIEQQVAAAIGTAAELVEGPIVLAGHSAGGHLVSQTVSANGSLNGGLAGRIERVASISGVHDLRPLLKTAMNAELGLTLETARALSPALLEPAFDFDFVAWVGGEELSEFRRQSALLVNAWAGLGQRTLLAEPPGLHHFSIIDDLRDAASGLVRLVTLGD